MMRTFRATHLLVHRGGPTSLSSVVAAGSSTGRRPQGDRSSSSPWPHQWFQPGASAAAGCRVSLIGTSVPHHAQRFVSSGWPCSSRQVGGTGAEDYSITFSACCRSDGGIVRPSALAVFPLMTRLYFVGCSMGRSAGFAPLSILST